MGGRSPLAAAGPRGAAVLVLLLGRVALCSAVEEKKGRMGMGMGGAGRSAPPGVPPPFCRLLPRGKPGCGRRRAAASRGERRRESPNYFFP